jgi:HEAT repeat protein
MLSQYMNQLGAPTPDERVEAVNALARHGPHSKPSVGRLMAMTKDPYPEVRLAAARALAILCPADPALYIPCLEELLACRSTEVRRKAVATLRVLPCQETVGPLARALRDQDAAVAIDAAKALGELGPYAAEAAEDLRSLCSNQHTSTRVAAQAADALKLIQWAHGSHR